MLQFLGAAIGTTWELPFEIPYIQWLQSLGGKGSFLYYLMNFISMFGEEMILVGVMGLIYWGIDKSKGEKIGFMMISASLLTPMVKNVVCRTRPFDSHPNTVANLRDVDGYSFPSGHSSGSASLFLGTAVMYRKQHKWLLATGISIPLLVALSRNYLGAHYPTDVVAGLALGVGVVFLANRLYNVLPNKYVLYGAFLAIGFAGFCYCKTTDYFTAYGLSVGFVLGLLFEQKVVNFQNTKTWWRIVLRVAVGGGLYLGLNTAIKAVVKAIYPAYADDFWFESIFRTLRYAILGFALIGVYPLLFAPAEKLWKKLGLLKEAKTQPESETTADETTTANVTTTNETTTTAEQTTTGKNSFN